MKGPLFSIIVPHHNTPVLLQRLLESLPWSVNPEVIVVDDASTAENLEAVQKLKKYFPFSFYHIQRHTAGAARNEGLRHASGEWLVFADADDYFLPAAAQLLSDHVGDNKEVVYFRVQSVYSQSGQPAYRDKQINRLFKRCEEENSLNALRALHTNPWGKMIRRSLVESNQIQFEEIPSANDALFSVRCGVEAKHVSTDDRMLYCITVSDESLTSNMTVDRFESNGQARLRVNAYLREHGLAQYQLSVLSYMLLSWKYGFQTGMRAVRLCFSQGNRPWVGASRLWNLSQIKRTFKSRPK